MNLTTASVVIQTEIWWNGYAELQALSCVHRQGQQTEVLAFRLEGTNSEIDHVIQEAQTTKTQVNTGIMEPLIRRHDEAPVIKPLLGYQE